MTDRRRHAAVCLAVFALALAVRWSMLELYESSSAWVAGITVGDAEMGRNLLEGRGWSANKQLLERVTNAQAGRPTMVDLQDFLPVDDANPTNKVMAGGAHSPGYSVWFAISYWLGGEYRYIYSQRMQAVLDSFAAVLVVAIGFRCWSLLAGVIGGVLYAVSPPHAFLANLTVAAATDSFWFLLAAFGAVVTVTAMRAGRPLWRGAALVGAAGFGGACMNSTPLVLPAVIAGFALVLAPWDRRYLRCAGVLVLAQLVVFAALTPWALRNQQTFGQFSLVRGSFWQLAFASWGELPNPWGLGFDDKEFFHWTDENCAGCGGGEQQEAMRNFLLSEVVVSAPFPRHVSNLLELRIPRLLDVARTPDGSFPAERGDWRIDRLSGLFTYWNEHLVYLAVLALMGLGVVLIRSDQRAAGFIGIAPTLFLTCFSLLFYVELRKTMPGYGYVLMLAGVALAAPIEWIRRRAWPRAVTPVAVVLIALIAGVTARAQQLQLAAGGELHTTIVNGGGEVWGWGNDLYGQQGDGQTLSRYSVNSAVQASGLKDAIAVSAGSNHTLALARDGSVWAWGDNSMGQLGDGTRARRLRPIQVPALRQVRAISGGYGHSLAIDADGALWAWGSNLYGQLGTGDVSESLEPRRVPLARRIVSASAGWFFSLAVDDEGRVWAWGRNAKGQLGNAGTLDSSAPSEVPGLAAIQSVAAGHQHGVALGRDGRIWSWGANDYGQTGVALTGVAARSGRSVPLPVVVAAVPVARAIIAGADHTLAMTAEGAVWAWGHNLYGQLGDGTYTTRATPAPVVDLPPLVTLGAGHAHAIGIASNGSVWTWGFGHYGQLGDGRTERRIAAPRRVEHPGPR